MITAVEIENFKGIRERTRVEIRPVTLLFGPNSAGKSTLLHAIQLAREIFTRRNYDVDRPEAGGEQLDLGGFRNFVHNRNLMSAVILRFDLDLSGTDFLTEYPVPEFLVPAPGRGDDNQFDASTIGDDISTGWVEFRLIWDDALVRPNIPSLTIGLDDEPLAQIGIDADFAQIEHLNIFHSAVRWPNFEGGAFGWLDYLYTAARPDNARGFQLGEPFDRTGIDTPRVGWHLIRADFDEGPEPWSLRECDADLLWGEQEQIPHRIIFAARPDGRLVRRWGVLFNAPESEVEPLAERFRQRYLEDPHRDPQVFSRDEPGDEWNWAYFGGAELRIKNHIGDALPDLDREFQFPRPNETRAPWVSPDESPDRERRAAVFASVMSRLLLIPCRVLRTALAEFRHLGPIRDTVPRDYSPPNFPDPRRWAGGLAAWDELCRDHVWPARTVAEPIRFPKAGEFCERVSEWLGDPERLNSGYSLEVHGYTEKWLPREFLAEREVRLSGAWHPDIEEKLFGEAGVRRRVMLITGQKEFYSPQDVGQGITQVVPVIVAALLPFGVPRRKCGLVAVEQPELHLNPRQQAALGDVFISGAKEWPKNRLIIETHSEHLILRLQRRIREATRRRTEKEEYLAKLDTPLGPKDGPNADPRHPPEDEDPLHIDVTDADIGVYYVRQDDGRTRFEDMPLDLNGDFVIPWPDDFFEIDFHERFGP